MDILDRLRVDLADAKRSEIERMAISLDIKPSTFRKIVCGKSRNPRYDTVEKIRKHYEGAQ